SGGARTPVHPLYDVTLVASSGEVWTIAGFERIEAGPMPSTAVEHQGLGQRPLLYRGLLSWAPPRPQHSPANLPVHPR
ncbi:MAG: hypothetical protein L0I24_04115, partial [Pseudonocardia sp.]|nr:hypothetical protein [Pseudonocardia sp.]